MKGKLKMFEFEGKCYKISAVIAAGGSSSRMGFDKLSALLCEKAVILRSIDAFEKCKCIDEIVVVAGEKIKELIINAGYIKLKDIVDPGVSRQKSVYNGVLACSDDADIVCIHDGARPLVTQEVILESIVSAVEYSAATAAVLVKDTIKRGKNGFITETVPRDELYQIQTPQVFDRRLYLNAYNMAEKEYSDDCQLIEALGKQIALSKGDYRNIKLTTAEDFAVAEAILKQMRDKM